jgi:hypothetical protein
MRDMRFRAIGLLIGVILGGVCGAQAPVADGALETKLHGLAAEHYAKVALYAMQLNTSKVASWTRTR